MSIRRRDFLKSTALAGTLGGHFGAGFALGGEPKPANPFLEGNFAPVHEEVAVDALEVIGRLPEGLDGMYVRNGPNPQFAPKGNYHWFDGDGMLHGVRIRDGVASYRNRYVRTAGWNEEHAAGKALYGGLAEPPDMKRLARGEPPFKNAANTALAWHDGKLLALWEGGEPYRVAAHSLDTVGPYTFGGTLRHAFTAHPKVDPATGEMMCFGYQPVGPYLQYSVVNPDGTIARTTPIELPRPVMMHDFAVTATRTVFLDLPATFNFARLVKGQPLLKYEPQLGARIGVLPRHGVGSDVKWFAIPPCYVFHTLNAHDDGDAVVVLACRMPSYPDDLGMGSSKPSKEDRTVLYRWRLDLKDGTVRGEPVDDAASEFPRVPDSRLGLPSRYGYAMKGDTAGFLKYDLARGTSTPHDHGRNRLGGEGVFVPRPGSDTSSAEDAGWLVTFVHDGEAGRSEMVVIDAREFSAPPVARVILPRRVPFGFHGIWLDGAKLA